MIYKKVSSSPLNINNINTTSRKDIKVTKKHVQKENVKHTLAEQINNTNS